MSEGSLHKHRTISVLCFLLLDNLRLLFFSSFVFGNQILVDQSYRAVPTLGVCPLYFRAGNCSFMFS